jgi:hypothetical protein
LAAAVAAAVTLSTIFAVSSGTIVTLPGGPSWCASGLGPAQGAPPVTALPPPAARPGAGQGESRSLLEIVFDGFGRAVAALGGSPDARR